MHASGQRVETKVLTDPIGNYSLAGYRVEAPDDTDVKELLESLGYQPDDLRRVAVVIEGKKVKLSQKLKYGDEVRFVLLAGGG